MAQTAAVLVLAELDDADRASLERACTEAGLSPTVEPSAEVATNKLGQRRFDALIVHMGTPGAALACMRARGKLLRIRIPVIALSDSEDDGAFAKAYRAGADDVLVLGRDKELTARLRALPKPNIPQPGNARGDAVVADADRTRGEVIERVLKDAGFRVEIVADGFAARLQAGRPSLKVAVVDASLDDVPPLITLARAKGSRCAWIVRARPELLDDLRSKLARQDRVAVVSAYGPPDDVLFEANRLLEPRASDGRADPRLLHGTIVKLTWPGSDSADVGYTYNVSPLGLFIRTLLPPSAETVKIEVSPPGGEHRARLDAKVVWRREFGTTRKEPVPAGFGVQIVGGDIDVWAEACPRVPSLRPPMPDEVRPSLPAPKTAPPGPPASEHPAGIVAPGEIAIRDPQASVEEMLADVLSETIENDGAAPLSIDGGTVVTLPDAPGASESAVPVTNGAPTAKTPVAVPPEAKPTERPPGADGPAPDITPSSIGFQDLDEVHSVEPESIQDVFDRVTSPTPPRPVAAVERAPKAAPAPAKEPEPLAEAGIGTSDTIPAPSLMSAALEVERALPKHPDPPADLVASRAAPTPAPTPVPSAPPRGDSYAAELQKSTGRTNPLVFIGIAVALGAIAAVVMMPRGGAQTATSPAPKVAVAPPPSPVPTPTGAATEAPASAASAAEPALSAPPPPSASAAPPSEAAPEPPPAAAPSAAPAQAVAPTAAADVAVDEAALATLKKGQGFLLVLSPVQTNVYVYGNLAGTTNQRIVTNCGPRFLRLGTEPGKWQSEGFVQVVKCGALTRVEMKP